ncbi:MAG: galactokinase [Senegalia sp. (in: firmicutes)]|uniref:galactokinase n=1 Tax=Senegalia sp. (in: firmicutes) TaxID=1924098 RepID=UPI003F9A87C6
MNLEKLKDIFSEKFASKENIRSYFAPGRVNLIGEHTDYNGGYVFPCALSFGTYAIGRKRKDKRILLYSENFSEIGVIESSLDELSYNKDDEWANYPKGITKIFKDRGYEIDSGFEILYFGNIPNGAGLSSSASISIVTSILLKDLFDLDIDKVEMSKLAQKTENEYIGVNCGIMDQFIVAMGKKDHAILLDTNTLEYEYAPINLENISIVIANTNKRRGLADSKYNERRSQCESALKDLQTKLDINSLGDLTEEQFEENKDLIKDQTNRKRAKHAVYENRRTIRAANILKKGDIKGFGKLMNASHISLRDDYEVTGEELDTLVSAAWKNDAIGARMTGAGFGGCSVNLVYNDKIKDFKENVRKEYKEKIGYAPEFYIAEIGDGAKKI